MSGKVRLEAILEGQSGGHVGEVRVGELEPVMIDNAEPCSRQGKG